MRHVVPAIAWILAFSNCSAAERSPPTTPQLNLNEAQALLVAKRVALRQGRDLTDHQLDALSQHLSPDRQHFIFVFLCKQVPPPSGCSFSAVVDRSSGVTEIVPVD